MGNERKTNEKLFKISHSGELLFWLVVVLIVVMISSISHIYKEKRSPDTYRIFLPDVDGLIVGSPVRMMGIEVGHVVKIKPIKDEVYVKFVLTDPDVYVPQGTKVTVEFTGLAGSKSLELYLPDEKTYVDADSAMITVMPPKRLHDALRMLNEMYNKFMSIIYSSSDFGAKLNNIDFESGRGDYIKKFLDFSNASVDENQKMLDNFNVKKERSH